MVLDYYMKGWYYYEHDKCRWDKTPYQLQWLGKLLEAEQQASIAPQIVQQHQI